MQAVRARLLSLLSGNRRNIPRRQAIRFAVTRQTGVHFAIVLSGREEDPINPISFRPTQSYTSCRCDGCPCGQVGSSCLAAQIATPTSVWSATRGRNRRGLWLWCGSGRRRLHRDGGRWGGCRGGAAPPGVHRCMFCVTKAVTVSADFIASFAASTSGSSKP